MIAIFIQIISRYMRYKESLARENLASNLILKEPVFTKELTLLQKSAKHLNSS
jgi:hypothetical protein